MNDAGSPVGAESCGVGAYCCAGGAQASKSNCKNAKTAQATADALKVKLQQIQGCCHTGGTDPTEGAHATIYGKPHVPCP